MKALFCINNLGVGGAERLVVDDINEMLGRGYSVRLLTFKKESDKTLSGECKIEKADWRVIPFSSLLNVVDWIKIYSYVKKEKPDIVLSHLWFSNVITRVTCKIAGIKNVISFEHNVYDTVKTKKMYWLDRFLQKWCKKIIAVSSAVKASLIEHGIRESRITVVNNGIDILKYNKSPDLALKEKIGISRNDFVFLTVGRLIPQKGIDILLQAFAKLQGSSVLLVVGQGTEENNLKELAQELGVSERVRFLGVRNDVPDVLAISDVFVLASRYEGLGIVVLEAMASRKPIIISDFEAGKDMIVSGQNGLVVQKESVEELFEVMNKIMSNSVLRENLAQKAYEKVQEFSIKEHVSKILSL